MGKDMPGRSQNFRKYGNLRLVLFARLYIIAHPVKGIVCHAPEQFQLR